MSDGTRLTVSFDVFPELVARAKREGRSVSNLARFLLREACRDETVNVDQATPDRRLRLKRMQKGGR